jgi:hypothetical protein
MPGSDLIMVSARASKKISVPPRRFRRSKFGRVENARFNDDKVNVDKIWAYRKSS